MINYTLAGDAHCCEVQICHNSLLVARKGLPGHAIYGRVRNANELLERLGLLDERTHRLRLTGCKEVGVSCAEAKMVGLTPKQIRDAGYSCAEAKEVGFTLQERRQAYSAEGICEAEGLKELKQSGMAYADFKAQGWTCGEAKAAGYSLQEVKAAGYVEGL